MCCFLLKLKFEFVMSITVIDIIGISIPILGIPNNEFNILNGLNKLNELSGSGNKFGCNVFSVNNSKSALDEFVKLLIVLGLMILFSWVCLISLRIYFLSWLKLLFRSNSFCLIPLLFFY